VPKRKSRKTLPKTAAKPSVKKPTALLPGVLREERVRCGRANCKCHSGAPDALLGPYCYRYWREDGILRKCYVRRGDVEQVRAACGAWRVQRKQERKERQLLHKAQEKLRQMIERLNELEQEAGEQYAWQQRTAEPLMSAGKTPQRRRTQS
jgi:hypothetical protein